MFGAELLVTLVLQALPEPYRTPPEPVRPGLSTRDRGQTSVQAGQRPVQKEDPARRTFRVAWWRPGEQVRRKDGEALAHFVAQKLGRKVDAGGPSRTTTAVANALGGPADRPRMDAADAGHQRPPGGGTVLAKLTRQGKGFYAVRVFARPTRPTRAGGGQGVRAAWSRRTAPPATCSRWPWAGQGQAGSGQAVQVEVFLGNHEAVCQAVEKGQGRRGRDARRRARRGHSLSEAPITGCKQVLGPRADKLKVIAVSDPVPQRCAHRPPGLPGDLQDTLKKAALGLGADKEAGAQLLRDLSRRRTGTTARGRAYEDFARLRGRSRPRSHLEPGSEQACPVPLRPVNVAAHEAAPGQKPVANSSNCAPR